VFGTLQVERFCAGHPAGNRYLLPRVKSMKSFTPSSTGRRTPENEGIRIAGRPESGPKEDTGAGWARVMPGFFETLGANIVQGRFIQEQDTFDLFSHFLYNIVIWAPGSRPGIETEVRKALASIDPNLVVYGVVRTRKFSPAIFNRRT